MTPSIFKIGQWRVDPARRTIERSGETKRLQPRLMGVLVALARAWPGYKSRDELIEDVWGVEHISAQALNNAVSKLRQALEDDSRESQIILTERTNGYCLLVEPVWQPSREKLFSGHRRTILIAAGIALAAGIAVLISVSIPRNPLESLVDNPENWEVEYHATE
ncbi:MULTISPECIES: winged helix-turn-helix domain-containing protein [Hyphobacterium]|uniref:Transcriptional regulator n=1 Tax=Hyphobacterium vulgare TaxID=1736751 RepID=A0ABV6ZY46_9PROT